MKKILSWNNNIFCSGPLIFGPKLKEFSNSIRNCDIFSLSFIDYVSFIAQLLEFVYSWMISSLLFHLFLTSLTLTGSYTKDEFKAEVYKTEVCWLKPVKGKETTFSLLREALFLSWRTAILFTMPRGQGRQHSFSSLLCTGSSSIKVINRSYCHYN